MADKSHIQWTDATWNPVTGCTKISAGCANCYIERTPAFRIAGRKFVAGKIPVQLHPDRLDQPLHWRKPRRIFVNSLSDLFHEDVPTDFIQAVFGIIEACYAKKLGHDFQILTKRPDRIEPVLYGPEGDFFWGGGDFLPNIVIGFSAEDQANFDKRWKVFQQRPDEKCSWAYALRLFCSLEPMLGPIDLRDALTGNGGAKLSWVIVGGESGPGARPFDIQWARNTIKQCRAAGVPVFIKQLGSNPIGLPHGIAPGRVLINRKGGDMAEWPEDLRVREFPEVKP